MEVEELETFQQQALEIKNPGEDFDPSKLPQNGEEYLMHMLYERKRCPAVVVKRNNKMEQNNLNTNTSSLNNDQLEICLDALTDGNLLPTIEWKNIQSCNFMRTRSKVMMLRQHLADHCYDNCLEPPLVADEMAWLKFCQQTQPLLSVILRFNQRTLEQLLIMLSDWIKGEQINESCIAVASTSASNSLPKVLDLACSDQWLGDWLYAILACLHLPLEPDVHSTLRDIARSCVLYRSHLASHEFEKAIPFNLFIYLIGKIFDQLDLLEYI